MSSGFVIVGGKPTIEVDPDSQLDYSVVWDEFLPADDDVASAVWSITPAGPVLFGESINNTPLTLLGYSRRVNTVTTAWVKTLTAGTTYELHVRMTSAANRKQDQTIVLKVKEQ